jgi:hypothetical protein
LLQQIPGCEKVNDDDILEWRKTSNKNWMTTT